MAGDVITPEAGPAPALPPLPPYPVEPGPARDEWHRLARLHADAACAAGHQAQAAALLAQKDALAAQAAALVKAAELTRDPVAPHAEYVRLETESSSALRAHAAALEALAAALKPGGAVAGADAVIAAHVRGIADALAPAASAAG